TNPPDAYTASDRAASIGNSERAASAITIGQSEKLQWPCTDCPCPWHAGACVKEDNSTHHLQAVRPDCSRTIDTAFPVELALELAQCRSSISSRPQIRRVCLAPKKLAVVISRGTSAKA